MLVIRCAQGVVAWIFSRAGPETGTVTCNQDGTVVALSRTPDATWTAAMGTIGAHSVALKGAIVEMVYIPADF
jgi:hypothetical protein